jgi:hypothetical protein
MNDYIKLIQFLYKKNKDYHLGNNPINSKVKIAISN